MGLEVPGLRLKSIQRGTISENSGVAGTTATLSAVDVTKARVRHLGQVPSAGAADDLEDLFVRLALTDATTLSAFRGANTGQSVVSYEVTDWG